MKRKITAALVAAFAAATMLPTVAQAEKIDPNNPGPKGVVVKPPPALVFPIQICKTITLAPWDDGPPIEFESCTWKCPAGTIVLIKVGEHELLCRDL